MEEFCKQLKIINNAMEKIMNNSFGKNIFDKEWSKHMSEFEKDFSQLINWVAEKKNLPTPPIALMTDEIDHILESGYSWEK